VFNRNRGEQGFPSFAYTLFTDGRAEAVQINPKTENWTEPIEDEKTPDSGFAESLADSQKDFDRVTDVIAEIREYAKEQSRMVRSMVDEIIQIVKEKEHV
jgi:hypothetical protein